MESHILYHALSSPLQQSVANVMALYSIEIDIIMIISSLPTCVSSLYISQIVSIKILNIATCPKKRQSREADAEIKTQLTVKKNMYEKL